MKISATTCVARSYREHLGAEDGRTGVESHVLLLRKGRPLLKHMLHPDGSGMMLHYSKWKVIGVSDEHRGYKHEKVRLDNFLGRDPITVDWSAPFQGQYEGDFPGTANWWMCDGRKWQTYLKGTEPVLTLGHTETVWNRDLADELARLYGITLTPPDDD